jgi:hypothetical protein
MQQMTVQNEKEILERCLSTWGKTSQITMVFEEMSELQKELCKNLRGRENIPEILDEIADVTLMLAQIKILFDISDESLQEKIRYKLFRIVDRLDRWEKENPQPCSK